MSLSYRLIEEPTIDDSRATPENPVDIGSYYILNVMLDGRPISTGKFKISLGANTIIEGSLQAGKSGPLELDRQRVWYSEYEIKIYPDT